ncbi:MAG: hypothetical protein ACI9N1_000620 [Flavobacteriales bacterium]|jgi:hypothetical protein
MKYILILGLSSVISFATAQTNTSVPVGEVNQNKIENPVRPVSKIEPSQERVLKVEKHIPQPATKSIKGEKKSVTTNCTDENEILKMECIKTTLASGELNTTESTSLRADLNKLETIFEKKMSLNFQKASKQEQSYFLSYLKADNREADYQEYISKLK